MKRKMLLLILLFASVFPVFAQIENEIQQSKTEKISKGRAYLLEKFLARDYDKVKEIKDYLMALEDDNYVALAPVELWHVLLCTKEFDALAASMRAFDSTQYEAFKNKVKPQIDQLGGQLSRRCAEDEQLIRLNVRESQLPAEDKDFIQLFLDWNLSPYNLENQTEWNKKSERGLEDDPKSDYDWFVRHVIRIKYEESNWKWGFNLGFGSGVFTQDLNDWMTGTIAGCFAVEAYYKRLRLALCMDGIDIRLRHNPSDEGDGSSIAINVSAGYDLIGWRRLDLTPFAAVGIGQVSSKTLGDIPELKELTKWRANYEFGVDLDFRFSEYKKPTGHLPCFIRLRYWYDMPYLWNVEPKLSGGCHCFLIGIGFSFGDEKRVY